MKIFAFGLGYCVQRFAELFPEFTITGTCRTTEKITSFHTKPLQAILFDDRNAVTNAFLQADLVIISAPPTNSLHPDPTLSHYHDLIKNAPNKYYCYLSTIGIYGDHQGAWVDESTTPKPTQERSIMRLQAERDWQDKTDNLLILRLAGIYGKHRNQLISMLDGKKTRAIIKYHSSNNQKHIFNRIHVDDIARAIDFCYQQKKTGIYNLSDHAPCPPDQVTFYVANLLNLPPPEIVNFDDLQDPSTMLKSFYQDHKRTSNKKITHAGFKLRYPDYQSGLRAILQNLSPNED